MKLTVLVLTLAATVSAQSATLPSCAQGCVTEYTTGSSIAGCNSLDIACICSSNDFISGISCCLEGACDAADQQSAIEYAHQICSTAGVTVPSTLQCNSTSSNSTSTASSTASATSTSSSSTATSSSTNSGASIPTMAGSLLSSVCGLAALVAWL